MLPESARSVTLSGRHVRLEPLSLAHVPGLVAAASRDRATYAFTKVPDGDAETRAYVAEAVAARDAGLVELSAAGAEPLEQKELSVADEA